MVQLNGELKRYKNQEVDTRQRALVTDVKNWMTDIYMVAGYTRYGASERKGLDGEILRYTSGSVFDIERTKMYRDTLDSYAQNPSIQYCEMVINAVSVNRKRLDTQYYNMIYNQVSKYVDTHVFEKPLTKYYKEVITQYNSLNILRNTNATEAKEQILVKMLDDHFIAHRKK